MDFGYRTLLINRAIGSSMNHIDDELIHFGTVLPADPAETTGCTFQTTEQLLKSHLAIFGGTRMGKSKLFEHLCRQLMRHGRGMAFIDPHSDTADDLLAFLACHREKLGLLRGRIHYLNPFERVFSYDPFHYVPDSTDPLTLTEPETAYRRWFSAKIKDVVRIITRKQGETEEEAKKTVLLQRFLYNGLYAVGVRLDSSGRHLAFWDLWAILNPNHPSHEGLYYQVAPHLEEQVRLDFDTIIRPLQRQPARLNEFLNSTINRLRAYFSPTTQAMLSGRGQPIDFRRIIATNGVILAPLGKRPGFHQEEGQVIAGLLIREIADALMMCPREKRRQFYLFIDEAQNFLGEDLQQLFKESAKYKLSLGLAVQSLDNLQRGEIDLVPTVLGQCGIRITFQQQYQPHAEELAKSLCYPLLDFTELLHEVDRDDGYEWVGTESHSRSLQSSVSHQVGVTRSYSLQLGSSWGSSYSHSDSANFSVNSGESDGLGVSDSDSQGTHVAFTKGDSRGESTSVSNANSVGGAVSEQESSGTGEQFSSTNSVGGGRTHSESEGEATGISDSTSRTRSESLSRGRGETEYPSGHASKSKNEQTGQTSATSDGHSATNQKSHTSGTSLSEQWHEANTIGHSVQRSGSRGNSSNWNHTVGDAQSVQTGENQSVALGSSSQKGRTTTANSSRTRGFAFGIGGADTVGIQQSSSRSHGIGEGISDTEGHSESVGESVTYQLVPLKRTRVDVQRTGQLEISVNDQVARHTQQIMCLDKQTCLVAIAEYHTALAIRVDNVTDPFEDQGSLPAWKDRRVAGLKRELYSRQPYFLPPAQIQRTSELPASQAAGDSPFV